MISRKALVAETVDTCGEEKKGNGPESDGNAFQKTRVQTGEVDEQQTNN